MKKLILFLLVFSLIFSASACQKRGAEVEVEPEPESEETEKTQEPTEQTVPEETEDEAPTEPERILFESVPSGIGEHAVSDGEHIFFTIHSGDDLAFDPTTDGLFRADLQMENPVMLARGSCNSLVLDGENVYFILEDVSGRTSVCSVDKNGTEIRRIVSDVDGADSLGIQDGKLFFVQDGALCLVEDNDNVTVIRYSPDHTQVLQAYPAYDNNIWIYAVDNRTLSSMLYIYYPEEERAWGVAGTGSRFAVCEGGAYYRFALEDQPEYEDFRQYEYMLMRMDQIGEPYPTYITGRFAGDMFPYGPYLFYTKYTEAEEKAGGGEATVRKLFCYDTRTGEESYVYRDDFIGVDFSIRGITGGRLFYNAYDYRVDARYDAEYMGCYCCDLTGIGTPLYLKTATAGAETAPVVSADDRAVEEYVEAREREREEELKNTPYGPGTSSLYLKAGSGSVCYRLVRVTGVTEFQVLLGPGEEVTKTFPCGKYILKVARGETWISDEEAFGPEGRYSTTDVFEFEAGASYEISTGTQGSFTGDSQSGFFH